MILFKLHVDLSNLNCRLHIISLFIFSAIGCFVHTGTKFNLLFKKSKNLKTTFNSFFLDFWR